MHSLLVVYQHIPHYRLDTFKALEDTPGWHVEFAAGSSSRDPGIAIINPHTFRGGHALQNSWIARRFLWQRGLLRLLLKRRDHVLFLGDFGYLSTWVGALLCRLRGSRVAFWTIGWHQPETGVRNLVRMTFYSLADQLLLYGNDAQKIGVAQGYDPGRMAVIGNSSSTPLKTLEESAERLAELEEALRRVQGPAVGAVIRLNPTKRLDLLIEAVARLNQGSRSQVSVVIAGSGPAEATLIERARDLGVALHLVGSIYGHEALTLFYSRCLVTAVPTLAGLSTLQSLTYGRPVVSHDDPHHQAPEHEAIVPGICGGLYRYGSIDHFAEVLGDWVQRVEDHPQAVAAVCKQTVADGWSPSATARRIIAALESHEIDGNANVQKRAPL